MLNFEEKCKGKKFLCEKICEEWKKGEAIFPANGTVGKRDFGWLAAGAIVRKGPLSFLPFF